MPRVPEPRAKRTSASISANTSPVRVAPRRLVEHLAVAVLDRVLHPLDPRTGVPWQHGSAGRPACLRPARAIGPSGASGRPRRSRDGTGHRPRPRRTRPPGARSGTASRRTRRAPGERCPNSSADGRRSPAATARQPRRSRPGARRRRSWQPGWKPRDGVNEQDSDRSRRIPHDSVTGSLSLGRGLG